jgi:hypothetical protein
MSRVHAPPTVNAAAMFADRSSTAPTFSGNPSLPTSVSKFLYPYVT